MIWEVLVPKKTFFPSPDLWGASGAPWDPKMSFLSFFFLQKSGSEPDLGVLGGQAGCQKIMDNLPYHPEKPGPKRPTRSGVI